MGLKPIAITPGWLRYDDDHPELMRGCIQVVVGGSARLIASDDPRPTAVEALADARVLAEACHDTAVAMGLNPFQPVSEALLSLGLIAAPDNAEPVDLT